MKIKKPGQLVFWSEKGYNYNQIGEIASKREGWYELRRVISLESFLSVDLRVAFFKKYVSGVHKSAIQDVPDWMPHIVFEKIFRVKPQNIYVY
jgi:hypothetical protein